MKVKFSVGCMAVYRGELDVRSGLSVEEIVEEIRSKLDEIPVADLEWIGDLAPEDAVTEEDVYGIEDDA